MLKATLPLSPTFGVLHKKRFKRRKGVRILVSLFFCEYEKEGKGKGKRLLFFKNLKKRKRLLSFKIQKGESFHNGVLRHILSHLFSLVALPSLLAHGQGGPKRQGVLSLLSLGSKGLKSRPKYLPLTHKKTPPHA